MKLVVCAKSGEGRFIGLPSASGYAVFTAVDPEVIQPGDILSNPVWDDEEGVSFFVKNLTNGLGVTVTLEGWSLTLDAARALVPESRIHWHPPWPDSA